eukprot:88349-Chlamydomonas_euryale.AAC.1
MLSTAPRSWRCWRMHRNSSAIGAARSVTPSCGYGCKRTRDVGVWRCGGGEAWECGGVFRCLTPLRVSFDGIRAHHVALVFLNATSIPTCFLPDCFPTWGRPQNAQRLASLADWNCRV